MAKYKEVITKKDDVYDEMLDALMKARANIIRRGDTPLVWTGRVPDCDEVAYLVGLVVPSQLIRAIKDADKMRRGPTFAKAFPDTWAAIIGVATA